MPPGILNFGIRGSADDREGKPVKITGALLSGKGPRHLSHAYVFVFHGTVIIGCTDYPFQTKPKSLGNQESAFPI